MTDTPTKPEAPDDLVGRLRREADSVVAYEHPRTTNLLRQAADRIETADKAVRDLATMADEIDDERQAAEARAARYAEALREIDKMAFYDGQNPRDHGALCDITAQISRLARQALIAEHTAALEAENQRLRAVEEAARRLWADNNNVFAWEALYQGLQALDAAREGKDVTEWQGDRRTGEEPTVWKIGEGDLVVSVHRWVGADGWFVSAPVLGIDRRALQGVSAVAARREGIALVRRHAEKLARLARVYEAASRRQPGGEKA